LGSKQTTLDGRYFTEAELVDYFGARADLLGPALTILTEDVPDQKQFQVGPRVVDPVLQQGPLVDIPEDAALLHYPTPRNIVHPLEDRFEAVIDTLPNELDDEEDADEQFLEDEYEYDEDEDEDDEAEDPPGEHTGHTDDSDADMLDEFREKQEGSWWQRIVDSYNETVEMFNDPYALPRKQVNYPREYNHKELSLDDPDDEEEEKEEEDEEEDDPEDDNEDFEDELDEEDEEPDSNLPPDYDDMMQPDEEEEGPH
jgi:hypothetical protein